MSRAHVLERTVLEITASDATLARHAQAALRERLHEALSACLDAFGARLAPDVILRLDRIDIELGTLAADDLDDIFAVKLASRLDAVLSDAIECTPGSPAAQSGRMVPTDADRWSVLERYLTAGTLDWTVPGQGAYDLDREIVDLLTREPAAVVARLAPVIDLRAAERLALQLQPATTDRLVTVFAGARAEECAAIHAAWREIVASERVRSVIGIASANVESALRAAMIVALDGSTNATDLAARVAEQLVSTLQVNQGVRALRAACVAMLGSIDTHSAVGNWIKQTAGGSSVQRTIEADCEGASSDRDDLSVRATPASEEHRQPEEILEPARESSEFSAMAPAAPASRAANISGALELTNAGLVLLWPMLASFLSRVGLLAERRFVSPHASIRAALLLQHIVDGDCDWPEHSLVLNKVLCGVEIETPVPRMLQMTTEEAGEAADLIDSAIAHWSALGATSAQGLRTAFLQRDGRLTPVESGWKLVVARAGYDVLLDRLPWGIGVVRLPWMRAPVYVEW